MNKDPPVKITSPECGGGGDGDNGGDMWDSTDVIEVIDEESEQEQSPVNNIMDDAAAAAPNGNRIHDDDDDDDDDDIEVLDVNSIVPRPIAAAAAQSRSGPSPPPLQPVVPPAHMQHINLSQIESLLLDLSSQPIATTPEPERASAAAHEAAHAVVAPLPAIPPVGPQPEPTAVPQPHTSSPTAPQQPLQTQEQSEYPRLEALIIPTEQNEEIPKIPDPRLLRSALLEEEGNSDDVEMLDSATGQPISVDNAKNSRTQLDLKSIPWVFDYYKARDDPTLEGPLDIVIKRLNSSAVSIDAEANSWLNKSAGWLTTDGDEPDAKKMKLSHSLNTSVEENGGRSAPPPPQQEEPIIESEPVAEQDPIAAQLEAICPTGLSCSAPVPLANDGAGSDAYNSLIQVLSHLSFSLDGSLSKNFLKRRDANQLIVVERERVNLDLLQTFKVSHYLIRILRGYRARQYWRKNPATPPVTIATAPATTAMAPAATAMTPATPTATPTAAAPAVATAPAAAAEPDTPSNLYPIFTFVRELINVLIEKDRNFRSSSSQKHQDENSMPLTPSLNVVDVWDRLCALLTQESRKDLEGCRDELEDWFKLKRKIIYVCDSCGEKETNQKSDRALILDMGNTDVAAALAEAAAAAAAHPPGLQGSSPTPPPAYPDQHKISLESVWQDLLFHQQQAQPCNRKFEDVTAYASVIGLGKSPRPVAPATGGGGPIRCDGRMISKPLAARLPRILVFKVINRWLSPEDFHGIASGAGEEKYLQPPIAIPEYLYIDDSKTDKNCQRPLPYDSVRHRSHYRLTQVVFHSHGTFLDCGGKYGAACRSQEPISTQRVTSGNYWWQVLDTRVVRTTLTEMMPALERGACLLWYTYGQEERPVGGEWETSTPLSDMMVGRGPDFDTGAATPQASATSAATPSTPKNN